MNARQILESLTKELNMAMAAADPHDLNAEYIEWMTDGTEGLIEFDHHANEFVWFEPHSQAQAARIEAACAIRDDEESDE